MGYVNANTIFGHPLSGSGKMVPGVVPSYTRPHATQPTSASVTERPSHVIVQNDRNGLQFCFETTASVGTNLNPSHSVTGFAASSEPTWINFGTFTDGTRLDISPLAWSGSGEATDYADGDVVFVYNDGRSPGSK